MICQCREWQHRPRFPRLLETALAEASEVPPGVSAVEDLSLDRVETAEQPRLWNALPIFGHPLGTATFAGRQVRDLTSFRRGVLGAVGFSVSALHLAACDTWIGWSPAQRRDHLHRWYV